MLYRGPTSEGRLGKSVQVLQYKHKCVRLGQYTLFDVVLVCVFQTWMSVNGSRAVTVPVKTPWDPTTVSASPALSSLTTTTAWVRIIAVLLRKGQRQFELSVKGQRLLDKAVVVILLKVTPLQFNKNRLPFAAL